MTYWHGGPRIEGSRLLPGSSTGRTRSGCVDGWVYITPSRDLAATYAATCNGWLYEVAPIGAVEQDPGSILDAGVSLRCAEATIVRRLRLSRTEQQRRAHVVANALHPREA